MMSRFTAADNTGLGLFTEAWMKRFVALWNQDEQLVPPLAEAGFNARIGYGFLAAKNPVAVLAVGVGRAVSSGIYRAEALDWDLRASPEDWRTWLETGLGYERFGYVIAHKRLQFPVGDTRRMMREPVLARSFLRSFELMMEIKTAW